MSRKLLDAPDPSGPIARLQQAAKRARDEGDQAQAEKLTQAAENLMSFEPGASGHAAKLSEEEFERAMRKALRPKA